MAVELAKVSLWLITLAGDRPLTFLDANLRCGNSLISAPLHIADYGKGTFTIYSIHPEADKLIAKESGGSVLTWSGKQGKGRSLWDTEEEQEDGEEKEPYTLDDEMDDVQKTVPALVDTRRWIAERPSETVTNVHDKAEQFKRNVLENDRRRMLEQICNLWVATWFWRPSNITVSPDDPDWIPPLNGQIYTDLVNYIRWSFGEDVTPIFKRDPSPYLRAVKKIIETVNPLHWELEFPEIYFEPDSRPLTKPGFHAVLGNPPWDIIKSNSREFFTAYDPGFREMEKAKADIRQQDLLKDSEIKSFWNAHVRNLEGQIGYTRLSNVYNKQRVKIDGKLTGGDTNTYKLFLERVYGLLHQDGIIGIIAPSGLYTDEGCTGLRQLFIESAQISYLFCFENRQAIFPIHRSFKFVLFGLLKTKTSAEFEAAFMLQTPEVLKKIGNYSLFISDQRVRRFAPDTLSIMELRSRQDVDIVERIYSTWPLINKAEEHNRFATFTREFDITNDRDLFNIESLGWPLFQGEMMHQYNLRLRDANYWIDPKRGTKELINEELKRIEKALDILAVSQKLVRKVSTAHARVTALLEKNGRGPLNAEDVRIATEAPRITFRKIARNTDERTLIATILPPEVFASDSLNYLIPWQFDAQLALTQLQDIRGCYKPSLPSQVMTYLCGVLNSFVMDYVMRFKVTANVNIFYAYQLPIPRLTSNDQYCRVIAYRVAQLVCIGPEFDDLRQELLGDINAHVATDPVERQQLQNEIDALVAHLYGLSRDDLEHILYAPYTFWLVKREIKDGVMEAFGRVGELL